MLGGAPRRLRLTMGALAEMDQRLGISGPMALAEVFREVDGDRLKIILNCLLAAPGPISLTRQDLLAGLAANLPPVRTGFRTSLSSRPSVSAEPGSRAESEPGFFEVPAQGRDDRRGGRDDGRGRLLALQCLAPARRDRVWPAPARVLAHVPAGLDGSYRGGDGAFFAEDADGAHTRIP